MKRTCKSLITLTVSGLILFVSSFWLVKDFNCSLINNPPVIEQNTKIENAGDGSLKIHSQLKIIKSDKEKYCNFEDKTASVSNSNDSTLAVMNYQQSALASVVNNSPVMFDSFTLDYKRFFTAWNFLLFLISFFSFSVFRKILYKWLK